jgi:hypothetical protein|tara:strand:+ start:16051 stop:16344 length:294 start_codon:yes stop_codon:yes gene_type:complete
MIIRIGHEDEEGRKYLVELPEEYQDMPESGVVIGPPDLSVLELPIEYEVKLNNQLFDRKLFKLVDVRRRPDDIASALKAVLRLDVQKITNLYKEAKE